MTTLILGLTVTVSHYWVNTVGLLSHFNREYNHGLTLGKAIDYVDVA
jgi:hypothetical protein